MSKFISHRMRWLLLFICPAFLTQALSGSIQQETPLDKMLNDSQKNFKLQQGILVTRLRDKKVLFEKNADLLLSPASVTKIATSAALLARFSPIHTFTTRFFYTGDFKNGSISGNLIVVGDGDPMLVSEKLWQMAVDLRNMGLKEVQGQLIIDQSLFDDVIRDEGRLGTASTTRNAYDAPITAFGINFNTVALTVFPGPTQEDKALLGLDPYPLPLVQVLGEVKTSSREKTKSVQVKRKLSASSQETLMASGSIPQNEGLFKVYRSIHDPNQVSGEQLRAFLSREGIKIRGKTQVGINPKGSALFYELESFELRRLVSGLNTFSNNYIADVLTKRLGAEYPMKGEPLSPRSGSYANGLAALKNFLKNDVKLQGDFNLENGSGLDTDNRMTARQVVDILAYMEQHMELFPDFLASLPATGWDGTMKKRFKNQELEPLRGMIRAKTGTLTEPLMVSSLAGYFRHAKHGLIAFCIIENGKSGTPQPSVVEVRKIQDRLLSAMLNEL